MPSDLGKYKNITPKARHVFECLKIIDECSTENLRKKEMMIHLKENTPFLRIIMWNFLPHIESILPKGPAPYTKNEADGEHLKLWEYLNTFPYYVKSIKTKKMNPLKIEQIFIGMLEALPADESDIIILAKDKNIKSKYSWLTNSFMKQFGGKFSDLEDDSEADDSSESTYEEQTTSSKENDDLKVLSPEELANSVMSEIENKPKKEKAPKTKRKRRTKAEIAAEKEEKKLNDEAEEKIKSDTPEPIKKDLDTRPLD